MVLFRCNVFSLTAQILYFIYYPLSSSLVPPVTHILSMMVDGDWLSRRSNPKLPAPHGDWEIMFVLLHGGDWVYLYAVIGWSLLTI